MVDAVECAAVIQSGVAEREAALPEDQRIAFRIGVNRKRISAPSPSQKIPEYQTAGASTLGQPEVL